MSINPCRDCHTYKGCIGMPYYSPGDIRYCRVQCLFLITTFIEVKGEHIVMWRFDWPKQESGYSEAPKTQHSVNARAEFEIVAQTVGQLSGRIQKTGKDGRLLVLEVQTEGGLSWDARNALSYCCGDREKIMPYSHWLAQRRYRWQNKVTV